MSRIHHIYFILICLITICGCTQAMQSTWYEINNLMIPPAETLRRNALAHEKNGDRQKALTAWRIAAELDPDNKMIAKSWKALDQQTTRTAQKHYLTGRKLFKAGHYDQARHQFLKTLRLTPNHRWAQYYLKIRLHGKKSSAYVVQTGDSFSKIAENVYKDSSKTHIIAYFNDLNPKKPLQNGKTLLLPDIEAPYLYPKINIKALTHQAQRALDQGDLKTAIQLAEKINAEMPGNTKAQFLFDTASFRLGMQMIQQKRYLAALTTFKQTSPKFKGRSAAIQRVQQHIQQQALTEKIKATQRLMKNKAYTSVIKAAEDILTQAPGNAEARHLLNSANYILGKQMLDKGEEITALEMFTSVDKGFQDTPQLITLTRARLNAKAETYYRNGVKHFINEELEKAIAAWEHTLAFNPDHPKAGQNIDNAMRLLEKWETLE